jgi:hypothetical protein
LIPLTQIYINDEILSVEQMISSGANSSQAEMYNLGRSSSLFRCSFEFAFCIDYEEPEDTKGVIRSIQET